MIRRGEGHAQRYRPGQLGLLRGALLGMLLAAAACGASPTDSPEKFHHVLQTYARHAETASLYRLFTPAARRRIQMTRYKMMRDLRARGYAVPKRRREPIELYRTVNGRSIRVNPIEAYGFATYAGLAQSAPETVFRRWCARRPAWKARIERMGRSRLMGAPTCQGDRARLEIEWSGTNKTLPLHRHKGQWFMEADWLIQDRNNGKPKG